MAKVKCAECGFLGSRNHITRQLEETELLTREQGVFPTHLGEPTHEPPACSRRVADLWSEAGIKNWPIDFKTYTQKIYSAIQEERNCTSWVEWIPGLTPKEHMEMLEIKARLQWQAEREDADRLWREKQERKSNIFQAAITILAVILGVILGQLLKLF